MHDRRHVAAEVAPGRLRLVEVKHVRVRRQFADAVAELPSAQVAERPPHEDPTTLAGDPAGERG